MNNRLATLDDHHLAEHLATEAGKLLVSLRAQGSANDGKALGKLGDHRAHDFLLDALKEARPGDAVLSEEGADDKRRLSAARVWIVDPLDGTREFGEAGRTDWAVHVALWEEGALSAAAVALPARNIVLSTASPCQLPALSPSGPRVAVSRSRAPALLSTVAAELGGLVVPIGSAGAKTAAVILGEVDAYLHAGGQYEWDSAAPALVAQTAGLHVSRLDGSPLRYNQPDPYLPDLLVCHQEQAEAFLAAVKDAVESTP